MGKVIIITVVLGRQNQILNVREIFLDVFIKADTDTFNITRNNHNEYL